METTVGNQGTMTQADKDAAARRLVVQGCFIETDPKKTQELMLAHNVTAAEMQTAMDYRIDATAWMHDNHFPDGFQGLKVWPDSEVEMYRKHTGNFQMSRGMVMRIIDREFGNHALLASHPIPWH